MKLIPTQCPKCSATIAIHPEQKHIRCDHCGSCFVIDRENEHITTLTNFETLLGKVVDSTSFLAADRRLVYLRKDITRAKEEFETAEKSLKILESLQNAPISKSTKRLQQVDLAMWVLGGTAPLFLVLAFYTTLWLILLTLAVLLLLVSAYTYRPNIKAEIAEKQRKAKQVIGAEKQKVIKAQMQLNDYLLEMDLCEKTVKKYRFGENGRVSRPN